MSPQDLERALDEMLAHRRNLHQLRSRIEVHPIDSTHVRIGDRVFTNFASNNYLGLTHHPRMREAIESSLSDGTGSGAAGLISGYTRAHREAEETIAAWKGTESCALLPSGYQANLGAVQTLASLGQQSGEPALAGGSSVRFLLDKLLHASLIDAVRSTGAEFRIFPHNHFEKLDRLLRDAPANRLQVVLTESIFSMDGDAADLSSLAKLKQKHPFILLLDEAHGSGVYGPNGAGFAAEMGLQSIVDVSIVTFSKALGCVGGAVCASQKFCDALLNAGRAYIYSTSVPPMIAAAAKCAVEILRDESQPQRRVRDLARRVREALTRVGMSIPPGDSPIVPVIVGDEHRALEMSQSLREKGLLVIAVRPPTVARGASRLRITLSSDHTDEEIANLIKAISQ